MGRFRWKWTWIDLRKNVMGKLNEDGHGLGEVEMDVTWLKWMDLGGFR